MHHRYLLAALAASALAACGTTVPSQTRADAKLGAIGNSGVSGNIGFTQQPGQKVMLHAVVRGLAPNSEHGFHIHERGDCADNGNAAGGHFNPRHTSHGKYDAAMHHLGDLPSLKADASGVAIVDMESSELSLAGPESIIGRALIVHTSPDDYMTQPTGNSGARIACAVIESRQ